MIYVCRTCSPILFSPKNVGRQLGKVWIKFHARTSTDHRPCAKTMFERSCCFCCGSFSSQLVFIYVRLVAEIAAAAAAAAAATVNVLLLSFPLHPGLLASHLVF